MRIYIVTHPSKDAMRPSIYVYSKILKNGFIQCRGLKHATGDRHSLTAFLRAFGKLCLPYLFVVKLPKPGGFGSLRVAGAFFLFLKACREGANSEKSSCTMASGFMILMSCLWVSLQETKGPEFAMEICLSERACSSAWHLAGSQHCKGFFHVTEELPSACADNLMRSTSKTFIVMNHIAMNSPALVVGQTWKWLSAQRICFQIPKWGVWQLGFDCSQVGLLETIWPCKRSKSKPNLELFQHM